MSSPALRLVAAQHEHVGPDTSWLEWLKAHVDPEWRTSEWDPVLWLFTGDLDNPRTAAWPCRSPGCPTPTRRHHGRCDSCRRDWIESGLSEEAFDSQPRRRRSRPTAKTACSVPGCEGEVSCRSLCFSHERSWRRTTLSVDEFIVRHGR